ncbi:MAG TPA: F0F1 ATP synthase subunit B [Mycobacteriales bacterium]|nr:F0F1 ATP synthase subunit B [Mycobacteriales bacterium]
MSHTTTYAEGNFLIPDATFLAEIVAFVVILAVIWRYILPPLQKNMQARQGVIRQQLEDARLAKERLDAAESDYATALAEARAEAARTREDARRVRQEIIDTAKDEARTAAEEVTRLAEERLQAQHRQVLNELRNEVGQLAVELAGRIVGESLQDEALQRRVVDRFLDELRSSEPVDSAQASAQATEQVH